MSLPTQTSSFIWLEGWTHHSSTGSLLYSAYRSCRSARRFNMEGSWWDRPNWNGLSTWSCPEFCQCRSEWWTVSLPRYQHVDPILQLILNLWISQISQYYILSMIDQLLQQTEEPEKRSKRHGILYDIGCTLEKSIIKVLRMLPQALSRHKFPLTCFQL